MVIHIFFNSMTNIKNFDPNLLSIDQVSFEKDTDCVIYEIEYFKNVDRANSVNLIFNNVKHNLNTLNTIPLKMIVKLNIWFFFLQTKIEKH